jgi:hypothetical protein
MFPSNIDIFVCEKSPNQLLFIENYLFVQTPFSKFDYLPNSASTPKTHKTIAKYNIEKLGTYRKFSRLPRENGVKFLREFESFSTLHELKVLYHVKEGPCKCR